MAYENFNTAVETYRGEHLKTLAEFALHTAARSPLLIREPTFYIARGGPRIVDSRLQTEIAGIEFENPLMVGAGWDKRGWAVDGLYELGFAGTEVGTVLPFLQVGNPRPRLFIDKATASVGLNSLGFNSKGEDYVYDQLSQQRRPGVVGINVSRNKISPKEHAPWSCEEVVKRLYDYADYFVINYASPNTPDLRDQMLVVIRESIIAVREAQATDEHGRPRPIKPIFLKTTVDMSKNDLDAILQIAIEEAAAGVVDSNTTSDDDIKALYGWKGRMGGVSGNDPTYRARCSERMRHITRETRGTNLRRIGVGAINSTETAMQRMRDGAEVIQLVTAIRERKARVARSILIGFQEAMDRDGVKNVNEYVGLELIHNPL